MKKHFRTSPPLDEAPVLLAVKGTLVLQPAPVVLDAGNLLTIVVGNGILRAAGGWVGAVALDACIEALLLLLRVSVHAND